MRYSENRSAFTRLAAIAFLSIAPAVARAQVLVTPFGNPTETPSATSPLQSDFMYYTVNLAPSGVLEAFPLPPPVEGQPPTTFADIFNHCLTAANYTWRVTNSFAVQGTIRLDHYSAWVETTPAITAGGLSINASPRPGAGGAALDLHYEPSNRGAANVRWIQLVRTNVPHPNAATWHNPAEPDEMVWYVDSVGDPEPFYDSGGGLANQSDFIDASARSYSDHSIWRGYLFLSTSDPVTQTISIANAAYWGFDDPVMPVPEPGTITLTLVGIFSLRVALRNRRSRSTRPVQGAEIIESSI